MSYIEDKRTRVTLRERDVINVNTTDFPGSYPGYDDSWSFEKFKQKFKIQIIKLDGPEMEFDLLGMDVALANAFRRILLAEVPTMAIDRVFMYNNTSVIPDESLAHRLGLVPIKADPRLFEYRQEGDEQGTAEDTIEFALEIKCSKIPNASKDAADPADMYKDHLVYSKHLEWKPIGAQGELYAEIRPVHDDVLIAKLRPGHEISLRAHCLKGIGKDHAKFSPVATASYRLMPEITLTREVTGEQATRLAGCFSEGVIEVAEDNGVKKAKVKNARMDTCSRNVFRFDDLKDCVKLSRVREHFIFSIESTGALTPDTLWIEAAKVLIGKCQIFLDALGSSM